MCYEWWEKLIFLQKDKGQENMIVDFEITDPRYCVKIPVPELGKEIKITLRKLKKAFYWEDGLMEVVMDIEYGEDYCWQSMAGVSLKGKCLLEIVEEALYQNIRRNLMGEVDGYRRLPELPSTCGFFYRYTFRKLCWWLREQAEFSFDIEGKAEDGSAIRAKYRSDGWWGNAERRGMAVGKRRCGGGPESDRRILPRLLLCKTGWNHVLQKNAFLVLYGERRKVQRRRLALLWADLPEDMEMGEIFVGERGEEQFLPYLPAEAMRMPEIFGQRLEDVLKENGEPGWERLVCGQNTRDIWKEKNP